MKGSHQVKTNCSKNPSRTANTENPEQMRHVHRGLGDEEVSQEGGKSENHKVKRAPIIKIHMPQFFGTEGN